MYHEVHIFASSVSALDRGLFAALPHLRLKTDCDPNNTPPGSICYEYPSGREAEFENIAKQWGIRWEWGIVGLTFLCCTAVGDYLYAVNEAHLLWIWDISDPEVPAYPPGFAALDLGAVAVDIMVYHGVCYVIGIEKIWTVDVDNPSTPTVLKTTTLSGESLRDLHVVGDTIFVAGNQISHIAVDVEDDTEGIATEENSIATQAIAIQGRRLYAVDQTAGKLRSYQDGGMYCPFITTGSLLADEIFAEAYRGRHGYFQGELVATGLTVIGGSTENDSGTGTFANYIKLGKLFIFWGPGTPEGNFSAPEGSTFHSEDGGAATSFYVKESGGSGSSGWVGK